MIRRVFVGLSVMFALVPSAMAKEAPVLTSVLGSEGPVRISRGGEPVKPDTGAPLQAGDEITTGGRGSVDVAWSGLWGCRVLEDSRIRIESLDKKDQRVSMTKGGMLFRFNKMPGGTEFRLETPTAIAAVRGTVFLARVTPDGVTSIAVAEGTLEVKTRLSDIVRVGTDEAIDIPQQGSASKRAMSAEEANLLRGAESVRTGRKPQDKKKGKKGPY